jgi:hypothetical protein
MRSLHACLILFCAACAGPAAETDGLPGSDLGGRQEPFAPARALRDDWARSSPSSFEQRLAELGLAAWNPAAIATLKTALDGGDLKAVRAAVLLAHGAENSRETLLLRLESRVLSPERAGDAGDVVAAAALARWADEKTSLRLAALAVGERPHPDLEVRVECAAVALNGQAGEEASRLARWLVRVLHAGTPAEAGDAPDWTPTTFLAWAKGRAAAALAERAGIPNRFCADGSFAEQLEVALEFSRRLHLAP